MLLAKATKSLPRRVTSSLAPNDLSRYFISSKLRPQPMGKLHMGKSQNFCLLGRHPSLKAYAIEELGIWW
jgi:hypothetical protein